MTTLQPVTIKMEPEVHHKLKYLAVTGKLTMGDFMMLLVEGFWVRLEELYQRTGTKPMGGRDATLIWLLLSVNRKYITEEEFEMEIARISESKGSARGGWSGDANDPREKILRAKREAEEKEGKKE